MKPVHAATADGRYLLITPFAGRVRSVELISEASASEAARRLMADDPTPTLPDDVRKFLERVAGLAGAPVAAFHAADDDPDCHDHYAYAFGALSTAIKKAAVDAAKLLKGGA